jgi:hypothetical protein
MLKQKSIQKIEAKIRFSIEESPVGLLYSHEE